MRAAILIIGTLTFATGLQAQQEVQSRFDAQSGRLEITNLELDGRVYYVELNLLNAETLTFSADASSIVDITPSDTQAALTEADIVGTWEVDGSINSFITFNSDGTYMQSQGAGEDLEACPNGGIETGTYQWTPSTGLIRFSVITDNNLTCGLSDSSRNLRFLIDGNVGTVLDSSGDASATRR